MRRLGSSGDHPEGLCRANWVLGRTGFCVFAQKGWGCEESNPEQISLEKKMFIEVGFKRGAVAEVRWYLSVASA